MRRTVWMKGYGRHGMHVRFCNVFDHDRDIIVPCPYCFVIRCCNESSIFVNEGDSVDGPKVLVVFLGDFPRVDIVLSNHQ